MAISDILSDASAEIKDYLETESEMYEEARPQILELVAAMDRLRFMLDTPPGTLRN